MPELKKKTPIAELGESFDQLMYMIKTTAPHLQSYAVDVREKTRQALLAQVVAGSSTPPVPAKK
jgi:hypothetical protein